MRAEFIRLALRQAIDIVLDRSTEAAYRAHPLGTVTTAADLVGWDEENKLAKPAKRKKKAPRRPRAGAKKRAA